MKKVLRILLIALLTIVLIVGGYVGYVLTSYHRLPDSDVIETSDAASEALRPGKACRVVSWNLGFGAYSADYAFFMDGGTESRARSREAVLSNIGQAVETLRQTDATFMLLQEVDIGSTRSYQVDEAELIESALGQYAHFAQNYDSPYLFYPVSEPHGASKSGLLTLSDVWISRRVRRSLPVESGLMKLLDLDRCYSKSYVPLEDGRALVLYNLHLSAYTSDGSIATEQLKRLAEDMLEEYRAGNYVVGGGDFNKDLLGNSSEVFGVSTESATWAQPIPEGLIPEGLKLIAPLDEANPVASCRNADSPYQKGVSMVLTVDGFIVSDNVSVLSSRVQDEGFAVSDHNPVILEFQLN